MSVLKRIASLFRRKVTKSVSSAESSIKKARRQSNKQKIEKKVQTPKSMLFNLLDGAFRMIRGGPNSTWSIPGLDASERQPGQSFWQPTPPGRRAMRRQRGSAKHSSTPWETHRSVKLEVHKPWNNPKGHRRPQPAPSCHQSWMMDDEIDQQHAAAIEEMQYDKAEQIRRTIG